jgi:hypothetical protein
MGSNEIPKLAILGQNEIPKRGGNREREREREEKGAKKGDAAAMAPAQVRPLPSPFKRVLLRCSVDVRSAYHSPCNRYAGSFF